MEIILTSEWNHDDDGSQVSLSSRADDGGQQTEDRHYFDDLHALTSSKAKRQYEFYVLRKHR